MTYYFNVWKNVRVTSPYGWRSRNGGEMHHGIDLSTFAGDRVPAFYPGRVVYAGWGNTGTGLGGYGNTAIIQDRYGYYHLYAHLQQCTVKKGDQVTLGTIVGLQGNTGDSDAPHLHYEIRKAGSLWGWKQTMHPEGYLSLVTTIDIRKPVYYASAQVGKNGEKERAVIIDNHVYVPARFLFDRLGHQYEWDNPTKTITIEK